MMVQQTARFLYAQKQPRILPKLDILKAFDSVNWTFLLEVMERLGFRRTWRDIIAGLLTTSSTQVFLNGVPGTSLITSGGCDKGIRYPPYCLY
jgi:hypothetical protein